MKQPQETKFHILLFTNKDSDNLGDKVMEACDIALIRVVMENFGGSDYEIESVDAEDIFRTDAEMRISKTDLVLIGGAPMFNYQYQNFYERTILTITYAQKYQKPVVFSAVGVDAYDEGDKRCMELKKALNSDCVRQITTRDGYEFVEKYKERKDLVIGKTSDPAVFTKSIFGPYILPKRTGNKKKIGVFVLRANGFKDNKIDFSREDAIELWTNLTMELERKGWDYELLTSGHFGDEAFLQLLVDKNCVREECCVFNMDTPERLISKISSYDGVISCRLHPNIISYALDVPAVGLVWNYKVSSFYDHAGYLSRAIDADQLTAQTILNTLEKAMQEGVHKSEEYLMSVYHSLYYGIASEFPEKTLPKPYDYKQIIERIEPYQGTAQEEQRENFKRKLRTIYRKYNALFIKNIDNKAAAKEWKDAYKGYAIVYNSGTKSPQLSWNYDETTGEIQRLDSKTTEYRLKIRGRNDGNTQLTKNAFIYPGYDFVGWQMRIKSNNQWYWYLDDGSLIPKEESDMNANKKIFKENETIPVISKKNMQTIVLEAVWEKQISFHIIYNCGVKSKDVRWDYDEGAGIVRSLSTGSHEFVSKESLINNRNCGTGRFQKNRFLYKGYNFRGWKLRIRIGENWYWYMDNGSLVLQNDCEKVKLAQIAIFNDEADIPYLPVDTVDAVVADAVWKKEPSYQILYNSGSTDTKHIKSGYSIEDGEMKTLPSGSKELKASGLIINGEDEHFKKNMFVRKGYTFAGWRLRVKVNSEWFWFLSNGILYPKKTYQEKNAGSIQVFIDRNLIPRLPSEHIDIVVAEAVWYKKKRRFY